MQASPEHGSHSLGGEVRWVEVVGGGGQHAPVALVAPRITLDTGDKPSGKALVGFQRQAKPSPKALRKGGRSRPGLLGSSLYCFAVAQSLSVCNSL